MKQIIYTAFFLIFFGFSISAQTVSGYVFNSEKKSLALATVSLLQTGDSAIVRYTNTDKNGFYQLQIPDNKEYILKSIAFGYGASYRNISGLSTIDFVLQESSIILQEVKVKGRYSGVKYGTDTIKYDVKQFIDSTEVVLGDVLNKLPGIEVDEAGNVKAQGKKVEKIMVDGKDYFGGSTQMATKNLGADIAETVEVLHNYSEYSLLTGFQSQEKTVINVGVNKSKYGKITGNVMAGGGIKEKYAAKMNLTQLNTQSLVSLLGALNNTGEAVFSIDDYFRMQGGLNEVLGNSGSFSFSEAETNMLAPSENTYRKTNGLAGLNFSYQPKTTFKLNAYALYNQDSQDAEDLNQYRFFVPDGTTVNIAETNHSQHKNRFFSGFVKMTYSPNETLSLGYKGTVARSNLGVNTLINNTIIEADENHFTQPVRTNHELMLMKALNNHIWLTNVSFNYSHIPDRLQLATDSSLFDFLGLSGLQNINERNGSGEISSALFYRLNRRYFLQPVIKLNFENESYNTSINDSSSDSLWNRLNSKQYDFSAGINLIKNKGRTQFKLGFMAQYIDKQGNIKLKVKENSAWYLNPSVELTFEITSRQKLFASFSQSVNSQSLDRFKEGYVFDSYKTCQSGSRINQLYGRNYSFSGRYMYSESYYDMHLIVTGNYSRTANDATFNIIQNGINSEIQYVMSPLTHQTTGDIYLLKGLLFIPWKLKVTGNYTNSMNYNYLSEIENNVKTDRIRATANLQSNYNFPLNVELTSKWDHTVYDATVMQDVTYNIQRYSGKLKYNITPKLYAESELEYVLNRLPSYNQELYILNALLTCKLTQKAEIRLSGSNILNINDMSWRTVSYQQNYELQRYYRKIPGNVLLSLRYSL